jgi:3-phenylpropionate/cinnamic acid dioxygenase small subunit
MCTTEDAKSRIRHNYKRHNTQLDQSDSAYHKKRFHVKIVLREIHVRSCIHTYMHTYIHAYMHRSKLEGRG